MQVAYWTVGECYDDVIYFSSVILSPAMIFLVDLKIWQDNCTGPHSDVSHPCKIHSDHHYSMLNKSGCTGREANQMKRHERTLSELNTFDDFDKVDVH